VRRGDVRREGGRNPPDAAADLQNPAVRAEQAPRREKIDDLAGGLREEAGIAQRVGGDARFLAAAHGIDVSPKMIEAARRRCAGLANVFLAVTSGHDLAGFADASLDLVLAVDAFPYIHHAGLELVATHWREMVRVLRPGGEIAIFNYSYRDDVTADRREFTALCRACGCEVLAAGDQPFKVCDGLAFRARSKEKHNV